MSFFKPTRRQMLADDLSTWEENRAPESNGHQHKWMEVPRKGWDDPNITTLICLDCDQTWELDTTPPEWRDELGG